ncbi:MAG: DEAD/DEAH box helicase family protein [Syntrophorhabdales bacterium]|jgi:superfamily II DNA or RNA helicase
MNARIETIRARLAELEQEKLRLQEELESLSTVSGSQDLLGVPATENPLTTPEERIALFMRLFRCRDDVFPKMWENQKKGTRGYSPACSAEWVRGVCDKPRIRCSDCRNRAFIPFDESVIRNHIEGSITVGTYTIRDDDTCIFLAADFDKEHWTIDALTYKAAARDMGVEVCIERSRSGSGAHAWIFFQQPIAARIARQLGTLILTEAMSRRHHIGFDSYDRLFPSQDTLPNGGFGNLIALPLQRIPRKSGNSVFVDENFIPYPDQWDFLSRARLLSAANVAAILQSNFPSPTLKRKTEQADPDVLDAQGSIDTTEEKLRGIHPQPISFLYSRHLEIVIRGLPSSLITALKRTATFANPKFFEMQRLRFSTWNTPRYICSAELSDDGGRMILPRGLLSRCMQLAEVAGAHVEFTDLRTSAKPISVKFSGVLLSPQKTALRALSSAESGVLVAPPGSGKTVIACALIAKRKLPTLILVHRKQLADQWKDQLLEFTDLDKNQIGTFDHKEQRRKGFVDIGMLQTLARDNDPDRLIDDYGLIVIDECHHVPAVSFEAVLKRIQARHFLGLTATPYRKDGLERIITMQCGQVLHTMDETEAQSLLSRQVVMRETGFRLSDDASPQPALHDIWQALVTDRDRLRLVASDVMAALKEGRFPLVLSDRKDHLESLLREITAMQGEKPAVGFLITSETGKRIRNQMMEEIRAMRERGESPFLLSTGSLIGEGFDLPELCTLVLAMPVSFKGRLVQYAGRLHRESAGKNDVRIYDYVDVNMGLGITMFRKRMRTYRKMGYSVEISPGSHLDDLLHRKSESKPRQSAGP